MFFIPVFGFINISEALILFF